MSSSDLFRRILGPYRISHHPFCENFKDHVYTIRGTQYCRGCVMQYSGMIVLIFVIIIGNIFNWWSGLNEFQIGFVLYLLILPTIITAFLINNRIMKDIARFMLGGSFTIAFVLFIFTPNLLIKLWILINFIPGYIYLHHRRSIKNKEICSQCDEQNHMPHCSGYQVYADREKIFMTQALKGGIHDPFSLSPEELND